MSQDEENQEQKVCFQVNVQVCVCKHVKSILHLDDEYFLLELPYEVSEEANEYVLAPERCNESKENH